MDDVSNGGGGPSGVVIADGQSNAIFNDVTELDRSNGAVSIRQLTVSVQTPDTDSYMGCTIVVSKPPNDPNVSITLAKCTPFARRTDIANTLENYLIQASEWNGFLFENHVAGQRSIQLFQRPGTPLPPIGRTFALIQSEGLPAQSTQYVRTTKVESVTRTFSESTGNGYADYQATVVTCELTDALRSNFAGIPPSRLYARNATKTVVRDTSIADAAMFYGATTLSSVGSVGDSVLKVSSVYTQLVPSSRTESIALDQKPASQRRLTLAQSPRLIEIGVTPHTMRVRVGQENRGFAWTQMLKPRPAPGTVVISYMALGNWYNITDDGLGVLTGAGVGTVNYQTGSVAVTMPAMPDAGSSIIFSWGENTAYTSRAGQAGYRAPEFAWTLPQSPLKPGSVAITWLSGNVLKTATDNGTGGFTGHATGEINYAAGQIFLRPAAAIDAGGEFQTQYTYSTQMTENFPGIAPDAGGFALVNLQEQPTPNSVSVRWVTVRTVSESSGSTEAVSKTENTVATTIVVSPGTGSAEYGYRLYVNDALPNTVLLNAQDPLVFKLENRESVVGTYSWHLVMYNDHDTGTHTSQEDLAELLQDGATSGTFEVEHANLARGTFALRVKTERLFSLNQLEIRIKRTATDQAVAATLLNRFHVTNTTPRIPPPADTQRTSAGVVAVPGMRPGGRPWNDSSKYVQVRCEPLFDSQYGWAYNPPSEHYQGQAQMQWSQADLAAGEKSLPSWAGGQVTYKIWTE